VIRTIPGRRIVWRLGRGIPLPIELNLDLSDGPKGVAVRHTITVGFRGAGRVLDPLFRLYFTDRFAIAMDEHAHREFRRLTELLTGPELGAGTAGP
jgi:hypothetical protein